MGHKCFASVEIKCYIAAMMLFVSVIKGIQIQMFDFAAIPQSFLHEHFHTFQNIHQIGNFKVIYQFLRETLKNHRPNREECTFMTRYLLLVSLMARSETH
jgi:hypothetical protein